MLIGQRGGWERTNPFGLIAWKLLNVKIKMYKMCIFYIKLRRNSANVSHSLSPPFAHSFSYSLIHSFSHSFIQAERSRFYEVLSGLKLKVGVGGM